MVQKSWHGSVPADIDVHFIFRRPRRGDGGMGVVLEKCRLCFHQNTPEIENLYPKEEVENLFVFHHDNAPSHRADSTQKFLEKNNMWLLHHPTYSLDLALCNFFIFLMLKLALKGLHLGDLEEIKLKMTAYLQSISKSDFKRCYDDWLLHLRKCIAAQGEYFEGDKINL